jgi:hypothetical protein
MRVLPVAFFKLNREEKTMSEITISNDLGEKTFTGEFCCSAVWKNPEGRIQSIDTKSKDNHREAIRIVHEVSANDFQKVESAGWIHIEEDGMGTPANSDEPERMFAVAIEVSDHRFNFYLGARYTLSDIALLPVDLAEVEALEVSWSH